MTGQEMTDWIVSLKKDNYNKYSRDWGTFTNLIAKPFSQGVISLKHFLRVLACYLPAITLRVPFRFYLCFTFYALSDFIKLLCFRVDVTVHLLLFRDIYPATVVT